MEPTATRQLCAACCDFAHIGSSAEGSSVWSEMQALRPSVLRTGAGKYWHEAHSPHPDSRKAIGQKTAQASSQIDDSKIVMSPHRLVLRRNYPVASSIHRPFSLSRWTAFRTPKLSPATVRACTVTTIPAPYRKIIIPISYVFRFCRDQGREFNEASAKCRGCVSSPSAPSP